MLTLKHVHNKINHEGSKNKVCNSFIISLKTLFKIKPDLLLRIYFLKNFNSYFYDYIF